MTTAVGIEQYNAPYGTDGESRFKLPDAPGVVKLVEAVATEVYRVVVKNGQLQLGEFTVGTEHSLPLGAKEGVPTRYQNHIWAYVEGPSPFMKFHQQDGVEERELQYTLWSVTPLWSADVHRTGSVSHSSALESNRWVWGKGGIGAVVMPNIDKDSDHVDPTADGSELIPLELGKMTEMPPLEGYAARMTIDPSDAHRISVYKEVNGEWVLVLGYDRKKRDAPPKHTSEPLAWSGGNFKMEAHHFPDGSFNGLVTLNVAFLDETGKESRVMASDTVLIRVSPWIMTPHNLEVNTVYVSRHHGRGENDEFFNGLKAVTDELNIPLVVVEPKVNRGDRWVQDEFETGYAQGATHSFPIVFNGPRNGPLDAFPEKLLGPNYGHFEINGVGVNSLDSFGNLEVSPPIVTNGQSYPFGRIIYGGPDRRRVTQPGDRQMMGKVRSFLAAQMMQSPIEIYSDWLYVGHVDEFMTFVPDNSPKGFKMLLASPDKTRDLLLKWQKNGYGGETLFKGRHNETTINDLLAHNDTWEFNRHCQSALEYNRMLLSQGLGLDTDDIIDTPVMFMPYGRSTRAVAYFPDMVNHLVIGNVSVVPKPYGAVINGECIFEQEFRRIMPNRDVRFIDDWHSYHERLGEVHCGTNVTREPFPLKWWEHRPVGASDI